MDDRIRELERATQAAPEDSEAAREYEAALLRAGQRDQVRQLYEFKFACPMTWSQFSPGLFGAGHCGNCDRDVHYVATEEDLAKHVAQGDCVAVDIDTLAHAVDNLVDHPLYHTAKERHPSCLVRTNRNEVFPQPVPVAIPGGMRSRADIDFELNPPVPMPVPVPDDSSSTLFPTPSPSPTPDPFGPVTIDPSWPDWRKEWVQAPTPDTRQDAFRKGAQEGYPLAMNHYGWSLLDGSFSEQDPPRGAEWLRRAAEQGDAGAMHHLGKLLEQGEIVPRDEREAVRWYQRGIAAGVNPNNIYYPANLEALLERHPDLRDGAG